jgi:hypothetical protein
MDGKGRTFQNVIVSERSFWVVQNEPGNEITGQFRSLEEAKRHALRRRCSWISDRHG